MEGVIPAVFDRDTLEIFIDNGMNQDLLNLIWLKIYLFLIVWVIKYAWIARKI